MLPRTLCSALVLVLTLVLAAPQAHAQLEFPQAVQDAGNIRGGPTMVCRFAFTNRGRDTVVITGTKPSCGCLKPRLSGTHFAPGESGWVELEVNTLSQPAGPVLWQVRVSYDEGHRSAEAVLQVRGDLTREVSAEPAALNIFTNQAIGGTVTITDWREKPFHVTAVHGSVPGLRATIDPGGQTDALAGRCVVRLDVGDDLPEGRHDAFVSILTDDPAYAELKIPVAVVKRARQRVTATPEEVSLSAATGQALPSQLVLLRSDEQGALTVERVEAGDPAVSARWAQGPGDMVTLRVLVDRQRMQSDGLKTTLRVEISSPVPQTVTIPVQCRSSRP